MGLAGNAAAKDIGMSAETVTLSSDDLNLLSQVAAFAGRQLEGKEAVYQGGFYSAALSCPVYVVVAMGEQALALQQVLTKAQAETVKSSLILAPGEHDLDGIT